MVAIDVAIVGLQVNMSGMSSVPRSLKAVHAFLREQERALLSRAETTVEVSISSPRLLEVSRGPCFRWYLLPPGSIVK